MPPQALVATAGECGEGGAGEKENDCRGLEKCGQFLHKTLATAAGATRLRGAPALPSLPDFSLQGSIPHGADRDMNGVKSEEGRTLLIYGEVRYNYNCVRYSSHYRQYRYPMD